MDQSLRSIYQLRLPACTTGNLSACTTATHSNPAYRHPFLLLTMHHPARNPAGPNSITQSPECPLSFERNLFRLLTLQPTQLRNPSPSLVSQLRPVTNLAPPSSLVVYDSCSLCRYIKNYHILLSLCVFVRI